MGARYRLWGDTDKVLRDNRMGRRGLADEMLGQVVGLASPRPEEEVWCAAGGPKGKRFRRRTAEAAKAPIRGIIAAYRL